jgi:hypothetical protein
MKMNSDLLDEYCRLEFGHIDWEITYKDGNAHITMYEKPREGYEPEEREGYEPEEIEE